MLRRSLSIAILGCVFALASLALSQSTPPETSAVRVSVTINTDGSRTVYEFDQLNHKATATRTSAEGKVLGIIRYQIDDAGRFASGRIFGEDGTLLYKSTYKYDNNGRLEQESHLGKDDALINKIIYNYDAGGRQTGYSIVDASGKVIGRTSPPKSTAPSSKSRKNGR